MEIVLVQFKAALFSFLDNPDNAKAKKQLKAASLAVFKLMQNHAKEKLPNRVIGADEWMPIMNDILRPLELEKIVLYEGLINKMEAIFMECRRAKKNSDASYPLSFVLTAFGADPNEEDQEEERKEEESKKEFYLPEECKIYYIASQMHVQAQILFDEGYRQESKEMSDYASQFKGKIDTFLAKPEAERASGFETFKREMDPIVIAGQSSFLLRNHTHWHTALKNLGATLSILGLVYLRCTAQNRGSFWFKGPNHPMRKLDEMKAALETKPNYSKKTSSSE